MPIINIDKEINLKNINIEEVKSLELLEPFGEGNKMPLFLLRNLKIDSIRALSGGKHLKLTLKQDNNIVINNETSFKRVPKIQRKIERKRGY